MSEFDVVGSLSNLRMYKEYKLDKETTSFIVPQRDRLNRYVDVGEFIDD